MNATYTPKNPPTKAVSRLQKADEHQGRPQRFEGAPRQGAPPPHRERLADRDYAAARLNRCCQSQTGCAPLGISSEHIAEADRTCTRCWCYTYYLIALGIG